MNEKKREEIAFKRYQLISPLLNPSLDKAEFAKMSDDIAKEAGLSIRTIQRYVSSFKEEGNLDALKPNYSGRPNKRVLSDEMLFRARQIKEDLPTRGLSKIATTLELEFNLEKDSIKKTTLSDGLKSIGYTKDSVRITDNNCGGQRFQRVDRNDLWQADFKYGPYINGKRTYLLTFLDDATRFIIASFFFLAETTLSVLQCLRMGIENFGAPKSVYFDNGSAFKSKSLRRTLALMNIRVLYTKPYSPKSKGKIEKFHQFVNNYINELKLQPVHSLDELNYKWRCFSDIFYQDSIHSALAKGMTPRMAFDLNKAPLREVDKATLDHAFLQLTPERRVDHSGCVNFRNTKFTADNLSNFIGRKLDIVWDPIDLSKVWIVLSDSIKIPAKPLEMNEWIKKGDKKSLNLFKPQDSPKKAELVNVSVKGYEAKCAARANEYLSQKLYSNEDSHASDVPSISRDSEATQTLSDSECAEKIYNSADDGEFQGGKTNAKTIIDFRAINRVDDQLLTSTITESQKINRKGLSFKDLKKGEDEK
jgi:transposase InsO family protein